MAEVWNSAGDGPHAFDTWGQPDTGFPGTADVKMGTAHGEDFGSTGDQGQYDDKLGGPQNEEGDPGSGLCYGCGQSGHRRSECPSAEPRACKYCKSTEHLIRDCPEKPPMICDNCGEEGHFRKQCEKAPKSRRPGVAEVDEDEAWKKIEEAISDRDAVMARQGIEEFSKARGGSMTFKQLQQHLFDKGARLFLIGMEAELLPIYTNIDLQGNKDKKYTISCRFDEKARRPKEREGWPQDREELLARLDDAGFKGESGVVICSNCKETGHTRAACQQERTPIDGPKISCYNCGKEGHRGRDCKEPRVDKFACKNCGKSGHKVADCPEEPNLDNVECRRCHQTGHFAKDCPNGGDRACRNCGQEGHMARDCDQPVNEANILCRNCEKTGHRARDCPEPKDWSKVKCNTCEEFGHTSKRCPQAPPEGTEDVHQSTASFGGDDNGASQGDGNWGPDATTSGMNDDGW